MVETVGGGVRSCPINEKGLECHKVPRVPHNTEWQPAWTHSKTSMAAEKRAFGARFPLILAFAKHHQTAWDVTECHACHGKRHDNLLGQVRKGDVSSFPLNTATPQENQRLETTHVGANKTRISCETFQFWSFRHVIKQVGMSQSATPAAKTAWQLAWTHSNRRFLPASSKPATRDKTRRCRKTSISYETSGNFYKWRPDERKNFAASPIDTARPRKNQTSETRHAGEPKRTFRARLPPIFPLCSFKIDFFLGVFLRT